MSYARNLLSRGEEIVFESRQHWFAVLGETWLFVIAAVLSFAVLIWQTSQAEWSLRGALQILSLGRMVVTDRLHAHIFCLMMGIGHVLVSDASGKNRHFYETWTHDSNLCRFARDPAEGWSMVRRALKQGNGGEWAWEDTPSSGDRTRIGPKAR